jgi:hypothetical protein
MTKLALARVPLHTDALAETLRREVSSVLSIPRPQHPIQTCSAPTRTWTSLCGGHARRSRRGSWKALEQQLSRHVTASL